MDVLQTVNVIEVLENYLELRRPIEPIRKRLDLAYRIEGQSVVIFELRWLPTHPGLMFEWYVAKATFVPSKNHWKVFWHRADFKWRKYTLCETVANINDFIALLELDEDDYFWG